MHSFNFFDLKEVYCQFHWCVSIFKEMTEHTVLLTLGFLINTFALIRRNRSCFCFLFYICFGLKRVLHFIKQVFCIYYHVLKKTIWHQLTSPSNPKNEKNVLRRDSNLGPHPQSEQNIDTLDRSAMDPYVLVYGTSLPSCLLLDNRLSMS